MEAPPGLTIGRIVVYRSRTGNYSVPAMVTATVDSLADVGVRRVAAAVRDPSSTAGHITVFEDSGGERGVPPLSSPSHVHLAVLTPGLPGLRVEAQDFKVESPHGRSENVAGAYQEWDVPFHGGAVGPDEYDVQAPGTWCWPAHV